MTDQPKADTPKLRGEQDNEWSPNLDKTQRNSLHYNEEHGTRGGSTEDEPVAVKDSNTAVRPVASSAAKTKKGQH